MYDLIAHIEYNHIPVIEARRDRLIQEAKDRGETPPSWEQMNLPLSCISRVFRNPHNPEPVEYKPLRISFNHFRNRPNREVQREQDPAQKINDQIDPDDNRRVGDIDFSECRPGDPEIKFACYNKFCYKRYKNIYALKAHMKSAHQMGFEDDVAKRVNTPLAPKTNQPPSLPAPPPPPPPTLNSFKIPQQTTQPPPTLNISKPPVLPIYRPPITFRSRPPTPPKASDNLTKCPHCPRRYKTDVGLKNHMIHVHEKKDLSSDGPSEEVVKQLIDQAKRQGEQERLQKLNESFAKKMPPARQFKLPYTLKINNYVPGQQSSPATQTKSFTFTKSPQPLKLSQSPFPSHNPGQQQLYQFKYQTMYPQPQQQMRSQNQTVAPAKGNQQPTQNPLAKPVRLSKFERYVQQISQQSTSPATSSYSQPSTSTAPCQPSTSTASSSYCEPSTSQAGQPSTSKPNNIRQQMYTVVYSDSHVNPPKNTQP